MSQLPTALLWQASGRSRLDATPTWSRPKDYRAPSWSWAAVDGLISMRVSEKNPGFCFSEVLVPETSQQATTQLDKWLGDFYTC